MLLVLMLAWLVKTRLKLNLCGKDLLSACLETSVLM